MLEYLEPAYPYLVRIDNKKQFMLAINLLYNKWGKVERKKIQLAAL